MKNCTLRFDEKKMSGSGIRTHDFSRQIRDFISHKYAFISGKIVKRRNAELHFEI